MSVSPAIRSADGDSVRESVTVVIPTFNVAGFFRPTLESIAWADQVIVVDMFSTDGTLELCAEFPNVRVVQRKDYIFANVNHGMELSTTDWVIRLDSDEVVREDLRDSILAFLANPAPGISTVYFRGLHRMFGFPMHHGVGAPESSWRKHMFRRGTAKYPCISEHEDIESAPGELRLDGCYDHFTNHTVEEVVRKFNYYTERDAERLPIESLDPLPPWRLVWRSLRLFDRYYRVRKGYKDGQLGFYTSFFRSVVYMVIDNAKRWERLEKSRRNSAGSEGK
jgi:glycosyltransferase involved in cell wall biosynthesis